MEPGLLADGVDAFVELRSVGVRRHRLLQAEGRPALLYVLVPLPAHHGDVAGVAGISAGEEVDLLIGPEDLARRLELELLRGPPLCGVGAGVELGAFIEILLEDACETRLYGGLVPRHDVDCLQPVDTSDAPERGVLAVGAVVALTDPICVVHLM